MVPDHQLAAVVALRHEAVVGGVDGLLLQGLRLPDVRRAAQFADFEVEEVQEVDAGDPGRPPGDGAFGGRVPAAGGDDPAQPEHGLLTLLLPSSIVHEVQAGTCGVAMRRYRQAKDSL